MRHRNVVFSLIVGFIALTHFSVIYFVGNCFAFAPDEELYFRIFTSTYSSQIYDHPEAWVEGSDLFFKLIFLPAKLFSLSPFWGDLVAFRVGSVFYLTISSLILFRASKQVIGVSDSFKLKPQSFLILVLPLLVPTFIMWSSFGLKENIIIFASSLVILGVSQKCINKTLSSNIYISIALLILLNTKIYIAYILFIALLLFWLGVAVKNRLQFSIRWQSLLLIIPFFLPAIFQFSHLQQTFNPIQSNMKAVKTVAVEPLASARTDGRTIELVQLCVNESQGGPLTTFLSSQLGTPGITSYEPVVIRTGPTNPGRSFQPLDQLPSTFMSFIFFPNFWEIPDSNFAKAQWFDSLVFCFLLFGAVLCLVRLRKVAPEWCIFLSISLFGIVAFYSLTEVNFGTLSRHRMILIPFVFAAYATVVSARADRPNAIR